MKPTFSSNFAVTSFVFEARYKKGLAVTYTCTTDEAVASWSVKATPEERPVTLSPWRVMLMGESSEDKSSFISAGHSGSGWALASISGSPSASSSVCGPLELPTKENFDGYNEQTCDTLIYSTLCHRLTLRTDVYVVLMCFR